MIVLIEKAIKKNFAADDGTPEIWKQTLKRLLEHSFIKPDEDFEKLNEDHKLFSRHARYVTKQKLVANYMKLHL